MRRAGGENARLREGGAACAAGLGRLGGFGRTARPFGASRASDPARAFRPGARHAAWQVALRRRHRADSAERGCRHGRNGCAGGRVRGCGERGRRIRGGGGRCRACAGLPALAPALSQAQRAAGRPACPCASADSGQPAQFAHAGACAARRPRAYGRSPSWRDRARAGRCNLRHAPARGARRHGAPHSERGREDPRLGGTDAPGQRRQRRCRPRPGLVARTPV